MDCFFRKYGLSNLMSAQIRPVGVTILAILEIMSGVTAIGFGVFFTALLGSMGGSIVGGEGAILGVITGIAVTIGITSFVMAWGLLKGKPWAWTITLILTIISFISNALSTNIVGLILGFVILYYLFRPHVKSYFGKTEQRF